MSATARVLQRTGITANQLTVLGFFIGLLSVVALAMGHTFLALLLLLCNRLIDGLDGELARLTSPTEEGSFLDITLDFVFYAAFPLGFAVLDPQANALPAAFLVASFVATGASFLAFASQAEKRNIKSPDFAYKGLYYLDGLAEGTETIACFVLMCLFPQHFVAIAWLFASVCIITAINRVYFGYRTLRA